MATHEQATLGERDFRTDMFGSSLRLDEMAARAS